MRAGIIFAAVACLGIAALPCGVAAQDYPSKPIRVIVPFPPGGSTDITGRIAADFISQRIGQTFVIENRPGAGTAIGHDIAAKAKPDGYTLVWGTSDGLSVLPAVRSNVPYKVPDDFTFIGAGAKSAGLLVAVPTKSDFKTLADLIAFGKANPGKLRYATSGAGGGGHLATELIANKASFKAVHVAYTGNANASNAVIGGFVDFIVSGASTVKPFADAGQMRALAVADARRHPLFPDVPTLDECGLPNIHIGAYVGFLGPAGLPDNVVKLLQREMTALFNDPKANERFRNVGFEPSNLQGEEFRAQMVKDLTTWTEVAKAAKIAID